MPNSYYEEAGAVGTASVSFTDSQLEYLNKAHLFVKAITSSGTTQDFTSGYTVSVAGSTTTVDTSGLTFPTGTATIRIFRTTPVDDLLTTFTNASLLRAEELNNSTKQRPPGEATADQLEQRSRKRILCHGTQAHHPLARH